MAAAVEVKPQPGKQHKFVSCSADISIYGGQAGGGKSFALLLRVLRHIWKVGYAGIVFRRKSVDLRDGGLYDEATDLFHSKFGLKRNDNEMKFMSKDGGFLKMSHLQYEKDVYNHQGKQYAFIGFDEVQHFTEKQFWYLLSRNRSSVIKPYMCGTCNPDPDSFLVNGVDGWGSGLISWWIDDDGYAIPERDGIIRYMFRSGNKINWSDTPDKLIEDNKVEIKEQFELANETEKLFEWDDFCSNMVKSVTFINSSIYDNKILLKNNPEYLSSLMAQNEVEKSRLLKGNWKLKEEGSIFQRKNFDSFSGFVPMDVMRIYADTAQSTDPRAAYSVFMLVGVNRYGVYILDVERGQLDVDDLRLTAIEFWNKHKKPKVTNSPPFTFRVEHKSSGIGLNQQLTKEGIPIDPIQRGKGLKWQRAVDAVYALGGKKIYFPAAPNDYTDSISWVEPMKSELLSAEKHGDSKGLWDQVDVLSDATTDLLIKNETDWVF